MKILGSECVLQMHRPHYLNNSVEERIIDWEDDGGGVLNRKKNICSMPQELHTLYSPAKLGKVSFKKTRCIKSTRKVLCGHQNVLCSHQNFYNVKLY